MSVERRCPRCLGSFAIGAGERDWYAARRWELPRFCGRCRMIRRHHQERMMKDELTLEQALDPERIAETARAAVAAHPVTRMLDELEAKVEGMEPWPGAADTTRADGELE